jgi:hypothetical protein
MDAMHLPGFPSPYLQGHLAPSLHKSTFFLSQVPILLLSCPVDCLFILTELRFQWVSINSILRSVEELNYHKYCMFPR